MGYLWNTILKGRKLHMIQKKMAFLSKGSTSFWGFASKISLRNFKRRVITAGFTPDGIFGMDTGPSG